jgi:hypothetical protein
MRSARIFAQTRSDLARFPQINPKRVKFTCYASYWPQREDASLTGCIMTQDEGIFHGERIEVW